MSKKASIAFEDVWQHESIALFTPKDGEQFIEDAKTFVKNLAKMKKIDVGNLSADRAMFLFTRWLELPDYLPLDELENEAEYYFGTDGMDGDNSDLGHYVINLLTGQVVRQLSP
jgi:hypothetical protein